jgi:pimeloyl-ACP methyl ester carboxylesterase
VSEEDFLKAGVSAFRSGDRQRAASIFAQLVKDFPQSEKGWYMLGMCVADPEQREYCFRRVLAINPNNPDAKKQLTTSLSGPPPSKPKPASPPPAWASQSQSRIEPVQSAKSSAPLYPIESNSKPTSPFVFEESENVFEDSHSASAQPAFIPPPQAGQKPAPAPKKKKPNNALFISMFATLFIGACGLGIAYLMFPAAFNRVLAPILPNQNTISLPTQTLPALIIAGTEPPLPPTAIPSPLPTVSYVPQFEETTCPFETPSNIKVSCGYAIVPEDRTGDPSKTIKLAVAVFHSTSSNPASDPVMFLQGGPGGQAVQLSVDAYDALVAPFIADRDYVTFDQRGTGLSEPALKCDELDKVYRQDIYGTIDSSTRELVYKNAFLSCNGVLRVNGANLNAYNTVESAADLKDIVHLLGYEKVDLYGASYGTRLALVTMRNHPEVVRSAILDSVVPVEANVFSKYPDSVDSALSKLFDSCAADSRCSTAYPNLETVFWDTVKKLDENPVTVTTSAYPIGTVTEEVDGSYLLSVILGSIKDSYFIETAPQTIYRVNGGDYSTLIAAQYSLPYAFDGINAGLYISMMCREHGLATTPEELQAAENRLGVKEHVWRPYYGDAGELYKACQSWGAVGPTLGENDAVISDIPSLIIEGSYDPATPPFFGLQVAEKLSNSYYFEFPNQGHVPTGSDTTGCAMEIAANFIDNPVVEPDRECLEDLPKVKFLVPYTGEPALELKEEDLFGITVDIPEDWFFTFDGFFVRGASVFDITQVGAFRAFLSAGELKDYFSLSAYGYRGLDGAPVEAGTMRANGLDWKLYIATSNARPVDIAMADDGGTSLIIMMFSHADEHDALYRTVFLPMVKSAR